MPTKEEFERLPLTELSVLCRRISDDPERYTPEIRRKASRLFVRWRLLQTKPSSHKENERRETMKKMLKKRMAAFLADADRCTD